MAGQGVTVALARLKQDLLDDLNAYGLADSLGRDHLFPHAPHQPPWPPIRNHTLSIPSKHQGPEGRNR